MPDDKSPSGDTSKHPLPDPRTAADDIDTDDPHKAEKLANIGKDTDVAEEAEKE